MKRRILAMLTAVLLLLSLVAILPVGASDEVDEISWRKLTYSKDPTEEGGEAIQGNIAKKCEVPAFSKIHFDPAVTKLLVNGTEVETGYQTTYAGDYTLTIINKAKPDEQLEYEIKSLADINVYDGQVFTYYPTVTCTNGTDMEYTYDNSLNSFVSGTQIRNLGKHLITVFGVNAKGQRVKVMDYKFYVKACDSVRVFDEASGKEALDVIVGEFDDLTVEATLDGNRPLVKGSNIVTEVGTHKLDAVIKNGEGKVITRAQSLPDFEELSLRITMGLPSLETKEPYTFDFSKWDATVLLDGEVVSGAVRVGSHGDHVLSVRGKDGKTVEGAFSVLLEDAEAPVTMTEVQFSFQNPHLIYAILVAVPTVFLLCVACYFLIARRRVV